MEPLPAGGVFEDVIESVEDQTKPKRDGGTFTVCLVKTAKHGTLECFDRLGATAKAFAGTAQVVTLRAEKSKYGTKLLEVRPVEGAQAESHPPASTPVDMAEIDPETGVAFPPGIAKARGYMRSHLAACKTEADIDALVKAVEKSGLAYQSPKVTSLVEEARRALHEAIPI